MLGCLFATSRQYLHAAELFAFCQALSDSIGIPMLTPSERIMSEYDEAVRSVQVALGGDVCKSAWDRGRNMKLDEAIDSSLQAQL
jgi:hypothetical protein